MLQPPSLKIYLSPEGGAPWVFTGSASIVIGRAEGADVRPISADTAKSISRRHAAIELSSHGARIRDLGSLNGTWLNGLLIGGRRGAISPQKPRPEGPWAPLADGDILTLGRFILRVTIGKTHEPPPPSGEARCPGCGASRLAGEARRAGDLCQSCRVNPVAALKMLRAALGRGVKGLSGLKGLRIEKTLGRGATSAVFLAVKRESGDKLALKVMPPAVSDNEWAKKSFLREVSLGRALCHPNVARLYEFGSYGGASYVLMEYCEGGSAEEFRVKKGGRLTAAEALALVLPMLDGLIYLHTVRLNTASGEEVIGLVHRDLKPANIFLGGPGGAVPKIADIGVAKFYGQGGSCQTRTGAMAGSPATMPRQQAINFKYASREVDVWAAAATFYKLVSGEYPRDFPPDQDPWRVVMSCAPRPLISLVPDFPPHLAAALDEALIDDPAIIHKTAQSLKDGLLKAARADGLGSAAHGH